MSLYEINVRLEDGTEYSLDRYKGKVLLIVNTASKCGLSPQFDDLETLYKKYQDDGLVVLGFPSNQFHQELASAEEAAANCRLTYGVTFPMHEVVNVNGNGTHPVFHYVKSKSKGLLGNSVKWNFTKFLVDRQGDVVQRFGPTDKPSSFEDTIQKLL